MALTRPSLAMAVCAVTLLGGGRSPGSAGSAAAPRPTASVETAVRLPVHEFRLTDQERAAVTAAQRTLVRRCMARAGFPGSIIPIMDAAGAELTSFAYQRRYGVMDQSSTRRWGYHLPQYPDLEARRSGIARQVETLPARERHALVGRSGRGGCVAAADRRLSRGVPRAPGGVLTKADYDSFEQSRSDPRVTAAFAAWSRCVGTFGFRFPDPLAALAGGWALDTPGPTPREIEAASADAHCKAETHLVEVWVAVESEIQRSAIDAGWAGFARIGAAKRAYLANVRRLSTQ